MPRLIHSRFFLKLIRDKFDKIMQNIYAPSIKEQQHDCHLR